MNHWKEKKLVEKSPNVVRLPTAAARRVQSNRYKEQRKAKSDLRKQSAHRFDYQLPTVRAASAKAERIKSVERSPALNIAMAILQSMDVEQRQAILASIAGGSDQEAHDIASMAYMSFGEANDLRQVFERLDAGQ